MLTRRFRSLVSERRWHLVSCLGIITAVTVVGHILGAWSGTLKGDDAYLHLGRVEYVVRSFPHLTWFSQSFAGCPPFRFETPAYYLVAAMAHEVTGLPIETLMRAGLYLSLTGLGLAIYFLARQLRLAHPLAFGCALLVFSMSLTMNWAVIGGAYIRVAALPLLFLGIGLVYRHLREIDGAGERLGTYVAVVICLWLLAVLHPLLWQWAFLIMAAAYLVSVRSWRLKARHLVRTLGPVAGMATWLYLPLVRAYPAAMSGPVVGGPAHDTTPMSWQWLVHLPTPDSWSADLGPLILPAAMLGLAMMGVGQAAVRRSRWVARVELAFLLVLAVAVVHFFAFGWLRLPAGLYRMAAYDYAMWLGLTLVMLALFSSGVVARSGVLAGWGGVARNIAGTVVVLASISAVAATVPFLDGFTTEGGPGGNASPAGDLAGVVGVARAQTGPDHRLHITQRAVTPWLYHADPDTEITGGRANYIPHEFYQEWANACISYPLNLDEARSIYFDDMPRVTRQAIGGPENLYPAMFWLDWYAAGGSVLLPPLYPQAETVAAYASRPQFFRSHVVSSGIGDLYYSGYSESRPVLVSTRAQVLAVPFAPGDAPRFYTDLLHVLSSLNIDSHRVIPVKLDSALGMDVFDTAVVSQVDYETHRAALDRYIQEGGHLIVMAADTGDADISPVRLLNPGVTLIVPASTLSAPAGSSVLAAADSGPVIYRARRGEGALTRSGISLGALAQGTPGVAVLLIDALLPDQPSRQVAVRIADSTIGWKTEGTVAGIAPFSGGQFEETPVSDWAVSWTTARAVGEVGGSRMRPSLDAVFNGGEEHDQVNFSALLAGAVQVRGDGAVSFDVWTDRPARIDVSFISTTGDRYSAHRVQLTPGEWVTNLIPLSAFGYPVGEFELSTELSFAVNKDPAAGLAGLAGVTVRLRDLLIRSGAPGDDGPVLQFVSGAAAEHSQVNWRLPLPGRLSAGASALLTLSLWHDGSPLSAVALTLQQAGADGYLYYDLPEATWRGWRDFEIPLSYFRWKEGEPIGEFDSVVVVFRDEPPDTGGPVLRQFLVRDVAVTTLGRVPEPDRLDGEWRRANRFEISVSGGEAVLWKESHMPEWRVTDDLGRQVDYYFAGPGMIYFEAPEDARLIVFEMPVPVDRAIGFGISGLSLVLWAGYIVFLDERRLRRRNWSESRG